MSGKKKDEEEGEKEEEKNRRVGGFIVNIWTMAATRSLSIQKLLTKGQRTQSSPSSPASELVYVAPTSWLFGQKFSCPFPNRWTGCSWTRSVTHVSPPMIILIASSTLRNKHSFHSTINLELLAGKTKKKDEFTPIFLQVSPVFIEHFIMDVV